MRHLGSDGLERCDAEVGVGDGNPGQGPGGSDILHLRVFSVVFGL